MSEGAYLPHGSTADGALSTVITPESAGWGFSGLRCSTSRPARRTSSRPAPTS